MATIGTSGASVSEHDDTEGGGLGRVGMTVSVVSAFEKDCQFCEEACQKKFRRAGVCVLEPTNSRSALFFVLPIRCA
ncbi:hypothetical protein [Caballeronia sp. LZ034LL]|uniref:hypothetical protein n=1 Tax=Caballeronia sp. LZ034LL TaxID=3038567 RepID=UPI0028552495|nr:hypothetical protein [Caballeronia sp. LZ034LL]MDR5833568.1 hypothetical protein [Caballeronia sp. LZ034LL]